MTENATDERRAKLDDAEEAGGARPNV